MKKYRINKFSLPTRLGLALMLCGSCVFLATSKVPTSLEKILAKGELRVLSRNGPTTYYEGPYGTTGFEFSLASSFADELGVELVIEDVEDLGDLIDAVGTPMGDLGAAGLTITEQRQKKVRFGISYLGVTQQLIYRNDGVKPESIEDLIGRDVLVIANSSHSERLRELKEDYPALNWTEKSDLEMVDLVEMVHSGKAEYAVVDSNAFDINHSVYPKATVAFDISDPQQLAWAFPRNNDKSLLEVANEFFSRIEDSGELATIVAQHYEQSNPVEYSGALLFASRVESRLPQWKPYLREAADTNDLDWRLLAAISYQESHWNSKAKSHTGVRGLMMLTQATAKEVGVKNRIDPAQSIEGGARYFKSILKRIPARVQGLDRTWMALAAYNVGLGHLEDARILTEQHGDNPNNWADVRQYLPLLAKKKYYKNTKHGFARGWEPVQYVQKVRHFYNVIAWHDLMEERRLASADTGDSMLQSSSTEADPESLTAL